jgi:transposase
MQEIALPESLAECHALIRQLLAIVQHEHSQNEAFASKIAALEARITQNSGNSSRPPSSNFGQNTPKNPPKQTTQPGLPKEVKAKGGQKGHTGNTLQKIEHPDEIVQLSTPICTCGEHLSIENAEIVQTYQVFDLPQPKLYVTEYQRFEQKCSCGKVHLAGLPAHIHANVQYGSGIRALTTLLSNSCQLSYQKVRTLFNDLFGYDLNESTAVTNNQVIYEALEPTEERIKEALLQSPVVHFDESGLKVGKALFWLHVACNTVLTFLFVHPKRGKKAHIDSPSILQKFKNRAIHDCFSTYFACINCLHALCNPHLLRELTAQKEQGKPWAFQIYDFLLDIYKQTEKGTIVIENIEIVKEQWQNICKEAIKIEEILLAQRTPLPELTLFDNLPKKRGRTHRGKALTLLDRLLLHTDAILAFAEFEVVPFSNNQAERDIRPIKTKLKVAGCFRTTNGAERYARIQGFISTCRKNKVNVFNELKKLAENPLEYSASFLC